MIGAQATRAPEGRGDPDLIALPAQKGTPLSACRCWWVGGGFQMVTLSPCPALGNDTLLL